MDLVRAATAEARLLWPLCDTGLLGRLPRLRARTLLLWGEQDRVIAPTYAERFANAIAGPTTQHIVPGAGHLADLDAPETIAKHIRSFLDAEAC